MTCIIGFRNASGDLYLVGDSRVSWLPTDVRVDDLQKLLFPCPHMVLAFSGDDLREVQRVLRGFQQDVTGQPGGDDARQVMRDNDRNVWLLERRLSEITSNTTIIVGVSCPGNPRVNRMMRYRLGNNRPVEGDEVSAGTYVVEGSVRGELGFDAFEESVVRRAFAPGNSIERNHGFLQVHWAEFLNTLPEPWDKVGETFHATYSREGLFWGLETTMRCIDRQTGDLVHVSIDYDEGRGGFELVDLRDHDRVQLIPLDQYDFPPQVPEGREFRAVWRRRR